MPPATTPPPPPREVPPALRRFWWLPIAVAIGIIVVLMATPVLVSLRVRRLRDDLSDGTDAARVIVNDLEVAVITQALAREASAANPALATAVQRERHDELALDSVVVRVGPDAVERVAQIRALTNQWQDGWRRPTGAANGTRSAFALIDAIEALDTTLASRAAAQRGRIQVLEHTDVLSATLLAPLALLAAGIMFWTGRRMLTLAHDAAVGHAALGTALDEKAALLRGVTHDLKNPLGAAYGYGELLGDGVLGQLSDRQRDVVGRIQGLLTGVLATVNDLLDLYRDQAGTLQIERTAIDLNALVHDATSDFHAAALKAGISLHDSPCPAACVVVTDPRRVRQILSNLVSNAVKYTPSGGEVHVTLATPTPAEPRFAVMVRDTGPGIPPALRERIFDEFYRLPSTATLPGTGVGLAISRRLARLLGGDVTVADAPDRGAIFTLWLPPR